QDPSLIAPATAAGPGGAPGAGGAGDGGGGSPVVVDQANTFGPVTAGFQTIGASITFPTPEFNLQPEVDHPAVTIDKVFLNVSDGVANEVGDVLNYTVTVTNTGDVE